MLRSTGSNRCPRERLSPPGRTDLESLTPTEDAELGGGEVGIAPQPGSGAPRAKRPPVHPNHVAGSRAHDTAQGKRRSVASSGWSSSHSTRQPGHQGPGSAPPCGQARGPRMSYPQVASAEEALASQRFLAGPWFQDTNCGLQLCCSPRPCPRPPASPMALQNGGSLAV